MAGSIASSKRSSSHTDESSEVEVWAACFADLGAIPDTWLAWLDEPERAALGRLRQPRDALAYAGRHAMARAVLGRRLGVSPEALRFATGPFGKPALAIETPVTPFFSLSRTGEVAVLALHSNTEIGIDIEQPAPIEASVARMFTASEQALLAGLPEPERTPVLTRLWVGKEAALKAAGLGLSLEPDRVEVALGDERDEVATATLLTEKPTIYRVRFFALPNDIIGAVTAERPVVPAIRWWRRCQWRAACSACTTSLIA